MESSALPLGNECLGGERLSPLWRPSARPCHLGDQFLEASTSAKQASAERKEGTSTNINTFTESQVCSEEADGSHQSKAEAVGHHYPSGLARPGAPGGRPALRAAASSREWARVGAGAVARRVSWLVSGPTPRPEGAQGCHRVCKLSGCGARRASCCSDSHTAAASSGQPNRTREAQVGSWFQDLLRVWG